MCCASYDMELTDEAMAAMESKADDKGYDGDWEDMMSGKKCIERKYSGLTMEMEGKGKMMLSCEGDQGNVDCKNSGCDDGTCYCFESEMMMGGKRGRRGNKDKSGMTMSMKPMSAEKFDVSGSICLGFFDDKDVKQKGMKRIELNEC